MNGRVTWLVELRRLVLLVAVVLALAWPFGYPFESLSAVLLLLLLRWLVQLRRLRRWLETPDLEPPDARGIWGEFYDHLYALRRESRDQRALLQSRLDYLQDSLSSMQDAAVMVTPAGTIEWCNAAAQRLLGLRFPKDRGQALLNLLRLPEFHRYFLADDYSLPLQVRVGSEREQYLQFTVSRFGNNDRLVFARDVTREARLENMRRDFVGNVSHELRTPLTVIKGYLDTLLGQPDALPARLQKPLGQMAQQADRMENLLRDLLWLTRIESLETRSRHEMVNIVQLLRDLRGELATSHPERRVDLDIETEASVRGDFRELYSAISNLVLNAIKYSPHDSCVTVRWLRDEESLRLSVRDQGPGIEASHIPRLTERFYRVDDSRSSRTGGTGLGLAIVKHVAMNHRATLQIDSKPGVGSTFSLCFPLPETA